MSLLELFESCGETLRDTCVGESSKNDRKETEHDEHDHHHFPTLTCHLGFVCGSAR